MSILLLSTGGGGGNILRSLKTLFDHDVEITRKADPEYAARLRSALTTRFLDTNEFALRPAGGRAVGDRHARPAGLGRGTTLTSPARRSRNRKKTSKRCCAAIRW